MSNDGGEFDDLMNDRGGNIYTWGECAVYMEEVQENVKQSLYHERMKGV
jgi:hypothetical protein